MRGIIFDLDDTLYPREVFVQSGFEAVTSYVADSWRRNHGAVLATLRHAHTHGADRREFQALCADHRLPLSIVPLLVKIFRQHRPAIALHCTVQQLLMQLRRDGWRLGILTNGDSDVQRRKIEALGLAPFVDSIIYAEEQCARAKPHPEAFLTAIAQLQLPPSSCIHVGDDPVADVTGAHAVGLRAIRVLSPPEWDGSTQEDGAPWRVAQADATVNTVLDVAAIAPLVLQATPRVF